MNDKCADRTSDKASNTSDCATKLLISGLLKKSFIVWQNVKDKEKRRTEPGRATERQSH